MADISDFSITEISKPKKKPEGCIEKKEDKGRESRDKREEEKRKTQQKREKREGQ